MLWTLALLPHPHAGVLVYRTAYLTEILVSLYFEVLRAADQLPQLEVGGAGWCSVPPLCASLTRACFAVRLRWERLGCIGCRQGCELPQGAPWSSRPAAACPTCSHPPGLQAKRQEELRGVFVQLEQLLQRGSVLLRYSESLPLLLRRTTGLLH